MKIGFFDNSAYSVAGGPMSLDSLVANARAAREDGMASYWIGHQLDWDAITILSLIGREVPDIELGTQVTHIWTSFPVAMAQHAATAHIVTDRRFVLGLGVNHEWVMREMWGLPFEKPVSVMEEYLEIVASLLETGQVDFEGDHYRVKTFFTRFEPVPDLQIILGALGPRMLRLAGTKAAGTSTWMTGLNTIRDHIVPTINEAAAEASKPTPRTIALMPMAVTDDEDKMRAHITEQFDLYHRMPSYQAMLEREGAERAGDIAFVGTRSYVEDQIHLLAEAGVTDLGAIVFGDEGEFEEARDLLRTLAPSL